MTTGDTAAAARSPMTGCTPPDLDALLSPRSIAVIGASDAPGNLGGVAVGYLQRFGFPGPVFPVNPGRDTVGGLPCYPDVAATPQVADLAIIAVAGERVVDAVRACIAAGVGAGIVWAGGFAEGGAVGGGRQDELRAVCAEGRFPLLGPNCIGLISCAVPVTATFASFLLETERLVPGRISLVGQSGGLVTSFVALAQRLGVGFRHLVSTGNEAVLGAAELIHAFAADPGTKVIAGYLEGVRDGAALVDALEAARRAGKPVVLLKGGQSAASARAAAAHTGALAGAARVWDAVMAEQAVVSVHSLEELLDVVLFLDSIDLAKLPAGPGVAPITFGGGFGVLAADQCVRQGLATPPLSEDSRARLAALVPPIAGIGNPFDLTPTTFNQREWMARLPEALDVIAADPAIDTILFQNGPMSRHAEELADMVRELRDRTSKAVCLAWPLAPRGIAERARAAGFHVFGEFARAINAIAKAARYRQDLARRERRTPSTAAAFDWAAQLGAEVAPGMIGEHECHRILGAAGLPVAAGGLAGSAEAAIEIAQRVGLPVVMKGAAPAVAHRAKAGLVRLDLRSADEVRAAYHGLTERAAAAEIALDGVYVQAMAVPGAEILVSAFRDPVFGIMVSCGAGGGLTELIDDVALARAPLDPDGARDLLGRLRVVQAGARYDLAPLAAFVARLSEVAASAPWPRFTLEVNPVRWNEAGVTAIDGLLVIGDADRPLSPSPPP